MSKFVDIAARYVISATSKSGRLRLAFDIEADGLVDDATKLHCIAIADLDNNKVDAYGPHQIDAALEHLRRADYVTGHNIHGYDLPLLVRRRNWTPTPGCTVMDTLVASRLILPNIDDLDDQAAAAGDPALGKLRGRYSLEAWGLRLGIPKRGSGHRGLVRVDPGAAGALRWRCRDLQGAVAVPAAGRLQPTGLGARAPRRNDLQSHHDGRCSF
jgi:hypothetical protein